jgi:hypothetical protein
MIAKGAETRANAIGRTKEEAKMKRTQIAASVTITQNCVRTTYLPAAKRTTRFRVDQPESDQEFA